MPPERIQGHKILQRDIFCGLEVIGGNDQLFTIFLFQSFSVQADSIIKQNKLTVSREAQRHGKPASERALTNAEKERFYEQSLSATKKNSLLKKLGKK